MPSVTKYLIVMGSNKQHLKLGNCFELYLKCSLWLDSSHWKIHNLSVFFLFCISLIMACQLQTFFFFAFESANSGWQAHKADVVLECCVWNLLLHSEVTAQTGAASACRPLSISTCRSQRSSTLQPSEDKREGQSTGDTLVQVLISSNPETGTSIRELHLMLILVLSFFFIF